MCQQQWQTEVGDEKKQQEEEKEYDLEEAINKAEYEHDNCEGYVK